MAEIDHVIPFDTWCPFFCSFYWSCFLCELRQICECGINRGSKKSLTSMNVFIKSSIRIKKLANTTTTNPTPRKDRAQEWKSHFNAEHVDWFDYDGSEMGVSAFKRKQRCDTYNLYWCKNEKRIGWIEGINECNELMMEKLMHSSIDVFSGIFLVSIEN